MTETFVFLLAAHCYGDFLFQNDWLAARKRQLAALLLHVAIHGLLAYLILQQWDIWAVPIALAALHGAIDAAKARFPASPGAYAADQLAHVASLAALAWAATRLGWLPEAESSPLLRDPIVVGAGLCAAVFGAGHFIKEVADRLARNDAAVKEALDEGLRGGGAQIGKLERALAFFLFLAGQPAGIGFLVAAKSILRFEEAKKQKVGEYVLIGTLWSFGLSLAIAWLAQQAVKL